MITPSIRRYPDVETLHCCVCIFRPFLRKLRLGRPATVEEWAVELAAMDGAEGVQREMKVMRAARARMISCNLRLVLHIARKKFYTGASGTLKVGSSDVFVLSLDVDCGAV